LPTSTFITSCDISDNLAEDNLKDKCKRFTLTKRKKRQIERNESYACFVKNLKIVNEMLAFEIKEKDFYYMYYCNIFEKYKHAFALLQKYFSTLCVFRNVRKYCFRKIQNPKLYYAYKCII